MPAKTPWTLTVHPQAAEELAALPDNEYSRIERALERVEEDPFRPRPGCDIKKLKDVTKDAGLYRLRVGDRRVIYATIKSDRTIHILVVDERETGYARLLRTAEGRM